MREIVLDTETTGFDPLTGDRLAEIVARCATQEAVVDEEGCLSYAELDALSNRIARVLPGLAHGFNPRPSLLTDESHQAPTGLAAHHSFNPRPSLLTDESQAGPAGPRPPTVSIHVRHC